MQLPQQSNFKIFFITCLISSHYPLTSLFASASPPNTAQLCPPLVTPWTVAARLLCPWGFPRKSTGVGCHFLLQASSQFRNQTCISCLLDWQMDSLPPPGKPKNNLQRRWDVTCCAVLNRSCLTLPCRTINLFSISVDLLVSTTPVLLPGESQGRGSLVGCRLWGRTESETTEVT